MFKAYDYFTRQLITKATTLDGLITECLAMGCCFDVVIVQPGLNPCFLAELLDN